MNILVYYPSNKRTISIETAILMLQKEGHKLFLLTIIESEGPLHEFLKENGVQVNSYVTKKTNPILFYFKHSLFILKYIRKNNIDIVFSHIQYVNIISVFAQFFTKKKFILFRHHDYPKNKKEKIADWIINKLAYKIVVPANSILKRMLEIEKVKKEKIKIIPYIYDFNKYNYALDHKLSEEIRKKYNSDLLLIMISRLVPEKRHMYVFRTLKKMTEQKINVQLLVLDEGSEKNKLQEYITENNLENHIHLLGFQKSVMSYLSAADVLVHPSVAEASCSVVKEAGLLEKIVIACSEVFPLTTGRIILLILLKQSLDKVIPILKL